MKVFYCDQMVADSNSFSPSAAKPQLAVEGWLAAGYPIDVTGFEPVKVEQLSLAHDPLYVRAVLSGQESNGFGNNCPKVAATLPYTSGAMLAAARHALSQQTFACAPVSGFHHAGYDRGGGFCTFNGLMVAALELLRSGAAECVGILDCDQHFGDGTEEIIRELDLKGAVIHLTKGDYPYDPAEFLSWIPGGMRKAFKRCDVLLYQAGADPHINDPLGGWLTTEDLRRRDELVFSTAKQLGLPVAWDLAGGYQRDENNGISPVLAIHNNTMEVCLAALS